MNKKKSCIIAVNETFKRRQEKSNRDQSLHKEEISKKIPEIILIEEEMSKNINNFMSFVMAHDKDEKKFKEYKRNSLDLQQKRAELLHENGYPIDYLDKKYQCDKCKDEGAIGLEVCQCYKTELSKEYLRQSNLAPILGEQAFKDFELDYYSKETENGPSPNKTMTAIYNYCKKYTAEFGKDSGNLLFYGNPGCGKSFLSGAIGQELINQGHFVLYSPIQEMISNFENQRFKQGDIEDTDVYYECDLLILDDLGTEFQTTFSANVLYNVINARINKKKPFIISTNLSLEEIGNMYDERIASRIIYESTTMGFPSVDIRLEKRKNRKRKS